MMYLKMKLSKDVNGCFMKVLVDLIENFKVTPVVRGGVKGESSEAEAK